MNADRLLTINPASRRLADLRRFYALLDELAGLSGGVRRLADCSGRMDWPRRGVYFFMEPAEYRQESGDGLRIVRVGTHALKDRSRTTLWKRLSQHKGQQASGGGNHRGSIFRLLVGAALLAENPRLCASWGQGSTASREIRDVERDLESRVSDVIREMPFLFLPVDDEAGSGSLRGVIERYSIALLSNAEKKPLDAASKGWLGHRCPRERVQISHLWNQNHTDEVYDPAFLRTFEALIHVADRRE